MVNPDNDVDQCLLQDIGEQGLLSILQTYSPKALTGDDAAVLPIQVAQSVVVTTDAMVDGVHFSDRTTSPEDVGWRAVAANLSDLAAMGAEPLGITVALSAPGATPVSWIRRLYDGMAACLQPFATPIVGGDVCRSSVKSIAIAAFGQVADNQAIYRKSAQPGQVIWVSGYHGSSRAGLELLLNPEVGLALSDAERTTLIQVHQRPVPRLDIVPYLRQLMQTASARDSVAGMDSSDGLVDAVVQICRASQVGARLDRNAIPMSPALLQWRSHQQALQWALYGGEDFELVLCLSQANAEWLQAQVGHSSAIIGRITEGRDVMLSGNGEQPDELLTLERGFRHF